MKTRLLPALLLAGSSLFAGTRVFIGVGVGGYPAAPPPAPVVAYAPPCPGPGYTWVGGYWYPAGARYVWRPGHWVRPPHPRARWVAPRYHGHHYYPGYWRR
jgi:hypothetical protein